MTRASDTARLISGGAVFNEASNDVDFRVESDANTHALFLEGSSGNVGIGTSSPSAQLHISGTDTSDQVIIENTDTGGGSAPDLVLFRNSASPADNDVIGRIDFRGDDDNGTARDYVTLFSTITDASTATPAGSFAIQTRNGSSQNTRLIVDGSGNVGIGTTSPSTILHLKDSDGGILQTLETGDSSNAYIKFINSTTGSGAFSDGFLVGLDTDESATFWLYEDDHMKFATNNTERMRIDSSGRVGIGATPTAQFNHSILQVGSQATLGANKSLSATGQTYLSHNLYFTTGGNFAVFNTSNANEGSIYQQVDGRHIFSSSAATTGTPTVQATMELHATGQVKIGENVDTLTSDPPFEVERNESNNDTCIRTKHPSTNARFHIDFHNSSGTQGNITVTSNAVQFNSTSDYRKKENVNYSWDGTTELKKLKPAKFNFIGEKNTVDGFLAHEVSNVVPLAVMGKKDAVDKHGNAEYQSMDASKLVPLMVKTIQELEARIATLESK